MARAVEQVREADLRPYQTHFLLKAPRPITVKMLADLVQELPSVIDYGVKDDDDRCKILQQSRPRTLNSELLTWLVYRREVPVAWAATAGSLRDVEHHIVILLARKWLLSIVTSDPGLGAKVSGRAAEGTGWADLRRAPPRNLENSLVHGITRTLWLSGIHRSVATKADSKVLIGPDVEASLDALGDQTYHYTSARCEGPREGLPASFVGVTPRLAKVWLGPCANWEVFLANGHRLLGLIEDASEKGEAPYPILARQHGILKHVRDAFDIGLAPPEAMYDEDPALVRRLEELLQGSTWSVRPDKGANCIVETTIAGHRHRLKIELGLDGMGIGHHVTLLETANDSDANALVSLLERGDLLKIFYESLHTYSGGQLYEVKTRPHPFQLTACDFTGCDITREKPHGSCQ